MNQTQRQFLIKKIQDAVNIRVKALENSIEQPPSLNNWLLHAVLSNNFELQPIEHIKEVLRQKALKATERNDWLGNNWGSASKDKVTFEAKDIFILPTEYHAKWKEYREETNKTQEEITQLQIQADGLITRITLASDKTLQTMINEVDDMGNISLMDTKIKLLTNG